MAKSVTEKKTTVIERSYRVVPPRYKKKVSIVMYVKNEAAWLELTILSVLFNTEYDDYEILIGDDGSSDGCCDFIKQDNYIKFSQIKYFDISGENSLLSKKNMLVEKAEGDYIVFLCAQCSVQLGWLNDLLLGLVSLKKVAISTVPVTSITTQLHSSMPVVPSIFDFSLSYKWFSVGNALFRGRYVSSPITTEIFMCRKNDWNKIVCYDPYMSQCSPVSTIDMSVRVWLKGFSIILDTKNIIHRRFDTYSKVKEDELSKTDYDFSRISFIYNNLKSRKIRQEFIKSYKNLDTFADCLDNLIMNKEQKQWSAKMQMSFKYDDLWYFSKFRNYLGEDFDFLRKILINSVQDSNKNMILEKYKIDDLAIITVPYITSDEHYNLAVNSYESWTNIDALRIAVINCERNEKDLEMIKQYNDIVIENDDNILARAWNKGIAEAIDRGKKYFYIPNLDVEVKSYAIKELLKFAKHHPSAGLWASRAFLSKEELNKNQPSNYFRPIKNFNHHFSSFMLAKETFENIGYFDEKFKPAYKEDCDYLRRLLIKGYKPLWTNISHFYHYVGGTNKHSKKKNQQNPSMLNRDYYMKKWGGLPNQEVFIRPFRKITSQDRFKSASLSAINHSSAQKITELEFLLKLISRRKIKTYVEIGTYACGTISAISRFIEQDAKIVSIDSSRWAVENIDFIKGEYIQKSQSFEAISADSQKYETFLLLKNMLNGHMIDFLLIDGDHTYQGVKTDFQLYSTLVKKNGLIAFHDVIKTDVESCQVDILWNELRLQFKTKEIISEKESDVGWGPWGGIGILYNGISNHTTNEICN